MGEKVRGADVDCGASRGRTKKMDNQELSTDSTGVRVRRGKLARICCSSLARLFISQFFTTEIREWRELEQKKRTDFVFCNFTAEDVVSLTLNRTRNTPTTPEQ